MTAFKNHGRMIDAGRRPAFRAGPPSLHCVSRPFRAGSQTAAGTGRRFLRDMLIAFLSFAFLHAAFPALLSSRSPPPTEGSYWLTWKKERKP